MKVSREQHEAALKALGDPRIGVSAEATEAKLAKIERARVLMHGLISDPLVVDGFCDMVRLLVEAASACPTLDDEKVSEVLRALEDRNARLEAIVRIANGGDFQVMGSKEKQDV